MKKKLTILFFIILLVGVLCIANNKNIITQKYGGDYINRESGETDKTPPKIEVNYSNKNKTKDDVTVTLTSDEEIARVTNGEDFFDSNIITYKYEFCPKPENNSNNYGEMQFSLFTPSTLQSDESIPLIIWLHGKSDLEYRNEGEVRDRGWAGIFKNWNTKGNGLKGVKSYVLCPLSTTESPWTNSGDAQKFKQLLEGIIKEKNIDRNNIILAGHSSGVNGAIYMTCKMPEYFSKNIFMSGFGFQSYCTPEEYAAFNIETRAYTGSTSKGEFPYSVNPTREQFEPLFGTENVFYLDAGHNDVPEMTLIKDSDSNGMSDVLEWAFKGYNQVSTFQMDNGWELSTDRNVLTKTYVENSTETIQVYDLAGNKTQVQINISNIDKIAPELEIVYDKTEMTNSDVEATIKSNEELQEIESWVLSENKKELTKIYTGNVTENIDVYDLAGNKTQIQINISNIDKIAPELEISYDKTEVTNGDVKVTIKSNEELQEKEGWEISVDKKALTKNYTANITGTIDVYDLAGNKTQVQINISNIDKIGPELEIVYDKTEMTNSDVKVTIKSNEELQEIESWVLSENKKELTKIYTGNVTENIDVYDLAGNKTQIQINISNIDKIGPELEIIYNKTEITNSDVKVTIKSNEEIQEVTGWVISPSKLELTKKYTKNTEENVLIKDLAGNESIVTIRITNIDKPKPEIISTTLTIDRENLIIKDIQPQTTVEEIKEQIETNATETKICDQNNQILNDNDKVGTGMKIELKSGDQIVAYTIIVKGDANGDGITNINDIFKINGHRLGINKITGVYLDAADVNGDGVAEVKDIFKINSYRLRGGQI